MLLCICQGNLHIIKKGIPSFDELGTIPNNLNEYRLKQLVLFLLA